MHYVVGSFQKSLIYPGMCSQNHYFCIQYFSQRENVNETVILLNSTESGQFYNCGKTPNDLVLTEKLMPSSLHAEKVPGE